MTSTAGKLRNLSGADSTSPMPRISRGARIDADRHVGAGLRATLSSRMSPSASRLARASSRSAAAASDDPPPSPAATGRRFVEREAAELEAGDSRRERMGGLEHELSRSDRPCRRSAPRTMSESGPPGRQRQPVADAGERHQAFDHVIAVGASAEHARASD